MKVTVEMTQIDMAKYGVCEEELSDWLRQALSTCVDTWDGGLVFLDDFADNLDIKVVA